MSMPAHDDRDESRPPNTEAAALNRRLAAILAADVVGYSRLMGVDEEGTHTRLRALHADHIAPVIVQHGGRVFKTTGDGLLAEFPSAVAAVRAAVDIHRSVASFGAETAADRRFALRIGVNIGDVIVEKGDVFGDGVNVAARIEMLAAPGETFVSGEVLPLVQGRVPFGFEDGGQHHLKNIALPVRVYRVMPSADVAGAPRAGGASPRSPTRRAIALALVAGAALATGAVLWLDRNPEPPPAVAAQEPELPSDRPSVVVLPFTAFEPGEDKDPATSYFIDGVTEDLITDLAKLSGLMVIARNSSFSYKGRAVDVRQVGRELGVRYVLEGSLRRHGSVFRINAQLIDATTGAHVWAERFDESERNLFALQDAITEKIVAALQVRLAPGEAARLGDRGTTSLAAYDAFLQGLAHVRRQTRGDLREGLALLTRAVEIEPDFARAHAALAQVYLIAFRLYWHRDIGLDEQYAALDRAERALRAAMARPSAIGYQVRAQLHFLRDRFPAALEDVERAIALDASDAEGYALRGLLQVHMGRHAAALPDIERARRLDPKHPAVYLGYLGQAYFGLGRYGEARAALEAAREGNREYQTALVHLVATYGWLDRADDARSARAALDSLRRGLDLAPYRLAVAERVARYQNPDDQRRLIDGLKRAGVP